VVGRVVGVVEDIVVTMTGVVVGCAVLGMGVLLFPRDEDDGILPLLAPFSCRLLNWSSS
jgi:hypothetical protein